MLHAMLSRLPCRPLVAIGVSLSLGACVRPASPSSDAPQTSPKPTMEATAKTLPVPPTWGDLQPGPYRVGFRQYLYEDESRSYRLYTESRAHARPVVAGVWYPAKPDTGQALTLGDYFVLEPIPRAPARARVELAAIASSYLRGVVSEEVLQSIPELLDPSAQATLTRVLDVPTLARRDAAIAVDEGPLLLAHPGLSGAYADNLVLYEYLASHGWVVVAGLFEQATGTAMYVDWDPPTSVRDLDVLRREAPRSLGFTPRGVAVLGHSYGAQAALVYASLPGRADAVVSLDSTMDREEKWWKDEEPGPWLDRAPLVRVPALLFASEGSSPAYFHELGAAPRDFVLVPGLDHNDFEALGGALRPLAGTCPSKDECASIHRRHLAVVASAASFLDSTLRPSGGTIHRVEDDRLIALGMQRERALEPSATPATTRALRSFDEKVVDCREDESCSLVEQAIAHAGELLALGRSAEALELLEARLADEPVPPSLHEAYARALASLGRYADAARAFEAEHAAFVAAKATASKDFLEFIEALEQRALRRRDRALALAKDQQRDPPSPARSEATKSR